jgi:protein-tyrosine phosphatase
MHYITETLFVGNISDASEPPPQVSAVLLVAAEFTIQLPSWLLYGRIPLSEYAEAEPLLLDRSVNWIEQHLTNNRVMVCCRAGMGRSVSVVMAYLCCVQEMPYDEVLKLVMMRRPGAMPLPNLEKAIIQVCLLREARATGKKNFPSSPTAGA